MTDAGRAAIAGLLRAHVPADAREAGFVEEMLALLAGDGAGPADPFRRDHYVPGHFTASAFVSSHDGRRLLLVHHDKLGRWLQPGGHFEPDDPDLWAAARREVAEETGLRDLVGDPGLLDVDIHELPPLRGDPPHRHYDLRVHLRCASPAAADAAGSGVHGIRWVPVDEDPDGTDESVLRAVRRLRGR